MKTCDTNALTERSVNAANASYRFGSRLSEEVLEISASQELDDDEPRVFVKADSDEVNDVWVIELAHNQSLH